MGIRDVIEGPAVIEWDSYNYYSEGTITIAPDLKLREMTSSYYGPGDHRVTDKMFTVSFTPIGMMDNNKVKYYPFDVSDLGKLIAPSTETPLYIYAANGQKITLPGAMIISPPQLLLGVDQGPMGQMQFACLGDITEEDAAADAHYKVETTSISAHSQDWTLAPTPGYAVTLTPAEGTAVTLDGLNGFVFDIQPSVTPRAVNRYGTVNYKLSGFQPVLTFAPAYKSESTMLDLLNIQGAGAASLGGSHRLGYSLQCAPVDSRDGLQVDFADCVIKSGSMLFGADDPRHGDYAFAPAHVSGESLYEITFPELTPDD